MIWNIRYVSHSGLFDSYLIGTKDSTSPKISSLNIATEISTTLDISLDLLRYVLMVYGNIMCPFLLRRN